MRAPRRVIIAEPSLKNEQGHYYAYAAAIGDHWRAEGAAVHILGNQSVAGSGLADRVRPTFSRDFWQSHDLPGVGRDYYAMAAVRKLLRPLATHLFFSDFQFSAQSPRAGRVRRFFARLMRAPMRIVRIIDRQKLATYEDRTWARRKAQGVALAAERLAGELRQALAEMSPPLGAGDLVILPTCGENEAAAVGRLLRAAPGARAAAWRLVFRRPLAFRPAGSNWNAMRVDLAQGFVARALADLEALEADVGCFTDTAQLSSQHDQLGLMTFGVLPIPHTVGAVHGAPAREEIVIAYVGDARTEKGFHKLPRLVEQVRRTAPDVPVRFRFQCNFNVAGGEEACVEALEQLREMDDPRMELIDRPLSREEYEHALSGSDVMLTLYDPDLYRERSSGILCEALAHGTPVLAPSGTWLESEFVAASDAVLRERWLGGEQQVLRGTNVYRLVRQGRAKAFQLTVMSGGDVGFAPGRWSTLELPLEAAEDDRLLVFEFGVEECPRDAVFRAVAELRDGSGRPRAKRIYDVHVGDGAAYGLFCQRRRPLFGISTPPWARTARLTLRNDYSQDVIRLSDLAVHSTRAETPVLGAIGRTYGDLHEIPEAAVELVRHIDHYRETARAYAETYRAWHNPDEVARALESRPAPSPSA